MKLIPVLALSFCVACLPCALSAQIPKYEISVAGGVSQFDAAGTGTAPIVAVRLAGLIGGNWLLGDLGVSYASLDEQVTADNTRTGVFEGQLQVQLPLARFRPYIGAGGGSVRYFNNDGGRGSSARTASASVGLRFAFTPAWLFRGEMRLRTWDAGNDAGFHNSSADFTAGLGFAF